MEDPMEREFAEKAIKQAMQDKRKHKVGAVIVVEGVERRGAHGAEISDDDHAECCLLERHLVDESVRGATLYVTLEPCTNSRHWTRSGTKSCAQIIVDRGIARVVIGMQDPDGRIFGRASGFLKARGIEVEFFPDDLRDQCEKLSSEWVAEKRKSWKYEQIFAGLPSLRAPRVRDFEGLVVKDTAEILLCPFIKEGWAAAAVKFSHTEKELPFPDEYASLFDCYLRTLWKKKRFFDDGPKVMLRQIPWCTSDTPTLMLETQLTRYSHVQFFKDLIVTDAATRMKFLELLRVLTEEDCDLSLRDSLVQQSNLFWKKNGDDVTHLTAQLRQGADQVFVPHALCAHMIVVTSDEKVLITKRSSKTVYFPKTWSSSFEENMTVADLDGKEPAALTWMKRGISEELGLAPNTHSDDNIRVLSVFLESDILNISICGFVRLSVDRDTLDQVLRTIPRTDKEFTAWTYLPYTDESLIQEILWPPSEYYHPTSRFRMLLALMKKNGLHEMASHWV